MHFKALFGPVADLKLFEGKKTFFLKLKAPKCIMLEVH